MKRLKTTLLVPLAILLLFMWGCGGGGDGVPLGGGATPGGGNPPPGAQATLDTDGDGVPDSIDAFPTQKVASVDTDGDGAPDAFNAGVTQAEIALSGLVLDAFPTQSVASVDSDNDGRPDSFHAGATTAEIAASGLTEDTDDDNDGVADLQDSLPANADRFAAFALVELPPLSGGSFALAEKINANGEIVGASTDASGVMQAVKWTVDAANQITLQALSPLGAGQFCAAYGINDLGEAAGQAEDGTGIRTAVLWQGTSPVQLSPGTAGAAYGINDSAVAVGMIHDATTGRRRATSWTVDPGGAVSGPVELGLLAGGTFSVARSVTDAGLVVGEADDALGRTHAVAWTVDAGGALQNGPVDLGLLAGGAFSAAYGANDNGLVVGEGKDASQLLRAVFWQVDGNGALLSGPAALGAPALVSGKNVSAFAVNASGWIAGTSEGVTAQGPGAAVVWDPLFKNGTLYDTVYETKASEARGVNDSGQVAGSFQTADGNPHGFVAVQVFLP